ncbi:MAG: hypothetical protein V1776_01205 [Candidatus Diapherotrites archaeon]
MRNAPLYFLFVLLFALAFYFSVTQTSPSDLWDSFFENSYSHTESQQGIIFASNDAIPSVILATIAQKNSFVLSPVGLKGSASLNKEVADALIQQQIVLGGHQKLTQTILRVYDTVDGNWIGCQTDFGTGKESEFISLEECNALLHTTNAITIRIAFPDAERKQPLVEVTPTTITIFPVLESDIPGVNFLLMRSLYADAPDLIGLVNQTAGSIQK